MEMFQRATSFSELKVPQKLPLLEGLCWNISNPYNLTPEQMLGIYEERWHFLEVLGIPSREEAEYIRAISEKFRGLPLIVEDQNKQNVFASINWVIDRLDKELFVEQRIVLGGGALIGLKYQQIRYSSDLDFLVSPKDFQSLRGVIKQGKNIFNSLDKIEDREPRIDRYGIRIPLFVQLEGREIALKLEIITEYNLEIEELESYKGLPCLNSLDRITAKILANADRWLDNSKFSRDLIDLAIIANAQKSFPQKCLLKAGSVYPDAKKSLIEAITKFQSNSTHREKCYEALQITQPEIVINGVDYLAQKFNLQPTIRTFAETDFSYLA